MRWTACAELQAIVRVDSVLCHASISASHEDGVMQEERLTGADLASYMTAHVRWTTEIESGSTTTS